MCLACSLIPPVPDSTWDTRKTTCRPMSSQTSDACKAIMSCTQWDGTLSDSLQNVTQYVKMNIRQTLPNATPKPSSSRFNASVSPTTGPVKLTPPCRNTTDGRSGFFSDSMKKGSHTSPRSPLIGVQHWALSSQTKR